jgi:hypothetical protein
MLGARFTHDLAPWNAAMELGCDMAVTIYCLDFCFSCTVGPLPCPYNSQLLPSPG